MFIKTKKFIRGCTGVRTAPPSWGLKEDLTDLQHQLSLYYFRTKAETGSASPGPKDKM